MTFSPPPNRLGRMNADPARDPSPILLFDGVCNLCHGTVQFIIARDPRKKFRFASLQSDTAQDLLAGHGLDGEYLDSLVLVAGDSITVKGKAAARIAGHLKFPWNLLGVFTIFPRFMLDPLYDWIARNRYQWFGKKEACPLPDPSQAERFLDSHS